MTDKAHEFGAAVLIDGAQAVPHIKPDVQNLDCDFYVFQDTKYVVQQELGILYGKESWLNKLPAYQGGGEMIKDVSFEKHLC
jgi:cysteine desulfurase/selenocysteine lyase